MFKRYISFCCCVLLVLTSTIGRVGYIVFSNNYAVSDTYNSYSLTIEKLYPKLYYSSGEALEDNSEKYIAVIKPNERSITDLYNLFNSDTVKNISNELKNGYPIIRQIPANKMDEAKYIDVYRVNSCDYNAKQLLSASSSGLLKYVFPYGEKKVRFHIDALGRMLQGDDGEVYEETNGNKKEITLSLNKSVEEITMNAAKNMKSGCVIVMKVNDSSVLSCVTKPDNSYINKPFQQYCVGSVFKIVVAACALENNIDYYYTCTGKTKVGDTEFSCQKNHIHGFENLKEALANSCNCYFLNLALKLGSDKLLETARKLGFEDEIYLYDNWKVKSAVLPTEKDVQSKGELALFGFGQGKLTATPLQICSCLCTIAGGGIKNDVRLLIDKSVENKERNVLSKSTSEILLKYLRFVVTNGTGVNAEDSSHKSAGKTATAQTGQYVFGQEMLNTWFAGVYPYDYPKYAIVVMNENGKSGNEDCAPIYREIVEKLKNL